MNKKWHLVCCKPNGEKKLISALHKRKLEYYKPLNRIEKVERNRKKIVSEPLFPLYVFVHIPNNEIKLASEVDSALNFVYWLGSPVVVNDDEIELIRSLTNLYFNIRLQKINVENKSAAVQMTDHFTSQNKTSGTGTPSKTVYKLTLPALGYCLQGEKKKAASIILNAGTKRLELLS